MPGTLARLPPQPLTQSCNEDNLPALSNVHLPHAPYLAIKLPSHIHTLNPQLRLSDFRTSDHLRQ